MLRQKVKRLTIATFASVALAVGGLAAAGPAFADGPGTCYSGSGCLYFDPGYQGASYDVGNNWSSFYGLYFGCAGGGGCDGNGVALWNNASSAANFNGTYNMCIYYNSNWLGSSDWFAQNGHAGWYGDLSNTYKNNASNLWQTGWC